MFKLKNIFIFLGALIILILVYVFFFSSSPEEESNLITTSADPDAELPAPTENNIGTQDFLKILLSVKSIKLDSSIFADPSFATLRDSSITLVPDGSEGRPNPFAPIGQEGGNPINTGSSSSGAQGGTSTSGSSTSGKPAIGGTGIR